MLLPRAPSSECAQSSRTYCIQSLAEHETAVVKAGDKTHSRPQRKVSEARQSWRHELHLLGYNADHTPTPSQQCSDVTQDPPSLLASMLSWILVLSVSLKCHSDTLTLFKSIEVRLARLAAGWAVKDLTSKLPSARPLWLHQLRSIRDDIKWIVRFC